MALLFLQLGFVFTVGSLLGPASVFAGGGGVGRAPRAAGALSVVRGAPLRLPCSAPDPRQAAHERPRHTNALNLNTSPYGAPSSSKKRSQIGLIEAEDDVDTFDEEDHDTTPDLMGEDNQEISLVDNEGVFDDLADVIEFDKNYKQPNNYQRPKDLSVRQANNRKLERKQLDGKKSRQQQLASLKSSMESSDDSAVTYQWFHNDTEIISNNSKRIIEKDGSLYFKRFGRKKSQVGGLQDTGEYKCLAKSSHGAILSTIITLDYASMSQEFSSFPVDAAVSEGDAIQLPCQIDSNPPANISWERNTKTLPKNKRYYILASGSLLITNMQKEDVGNYRCTATNDILPSKKRHSPQAYISITNIPESSSPLRFVQDQDSTDTSPTDTSLPPRIRNLTVLKLDDVYMACAVQGRPKPKVTWNYKSEMDDQREISSMEVLKIESVTENHDGLYTCMAANDNQSIHQAYRLSVLQAPYLKQQPSSEYTPTAKTVRFNCSAGGNPEPKVAWYKDGRPLSITGRVKLKPQDQSKPPALIVSDTISADKGVYQCIASNSVGEVSAWAALTVKVFSEAPVPARPRCRPRGAQFAELTWEAPPRLKIMAYTVHKMADKEGVEEHSQLVQENRYNLTEDIEPYKRYHVYVKTYIGVGGSQPSENVTCQGQGVPIQLFTVGNNSLLVYWKTVADDAPQVKQWMVQHRTSPGQVTNITLPANYTAYLIQDESQLSAVEVRVLASPENDWLEQDLSLIPWDGANKSTPLNNFDINAYSAPNNSFYLEDLILGGVKKQAPTFWQNWQLRPTSLSVEPLGARAVNVSWRCVAAEATPQAFHFNVYYNQYREDGESSDKDSEKCSKTNNNWIVIGDLYPRTMYSFKVQAVMQNQRRLGPMSDIVTSHIENDAPVAVTDIKWTVSKKNLYRISWKPNKPAESASGDEKAVSAEEEGKPVGYSVYYNVNPMDPLEQWQCVNVTSNVTEVEFQFVKTAKLFYVMIAPLGEQRGSVIAIQVDKERPGAPLGDPDLTSSNSTEHHEEDDTSLGQLLALIGIVVGVSLLLISVAICAGFLIWRHRKLGRHPQPAQGSQVRSNRIGRSDYECQELVGSPTNDAKGGVVYINGISAAPTRGRGVGEPLLNGQVHITENPRHSSKKLPNGNCRPLMKKKTYSGACEGVLDVSRYEGLPDVTMETTLESDITARSYTPDTSTFISDQSEERSSSLRQNPSLDNLNSISNTVDSFHLDRNSNSDRSAAKSLNAETDKVGPAIIHRPANLKVDNVKYNCALDAVTALDYRESGGGRRLAPALGPNG